MRPRLKCKNTPSISNLTLTLCCSLYPRGNRSNHWQVAAFPVLPPAPVSIPYRFVTCHVCRYSPHLWVMNLKQAWTENLIGAFISDRAVKCRFSHRPAFAKSRQRCLSFGFQINASVYCSLPSGYLWMNSLIGRRCLQLAVYVLEEDQVT